MEQNWLTINQIINSKKHDKIAKTYNGFKSWISKGYINAKKDLDNNTTLLCLNDLDSLLKLLSTLENDFITQYEFVQNLGITKLKCDEILNFCQEQNIDYQYFEDGVVINKKNIQLFINKTDLIIFLDTHIRYQTVLHKFDINDSKIRRLVEKHNIKTISITKHCYFFRLVDAEQYFNTVEFDMNDYYSLSEVYSLLNTNKNSLTPIKKEENLLSVKVGKQVFYSKERINHLVKKIDAIKHEYFSSRDIQNILNLKYIPYESLTHYPTNALARHALGGAITSMFSKDEVYEYKKNVIVREAINESLDNSVEAKEMFEKILYIKEILFSKNSKYTEQVWFSYCEQKLFSIVDTNLKNSVLSFVDCTELLSNFTIEKELYSFTSNEINLFLFNHQVSIKKQQFLYSFLLEYHAKITNFLFESKEKKKTFDMAKIKSPYTHEFNERKKEIYDYAVYHKVYDYAKERSHKECAILDAELIVNCTGNPTYYASSWLYVLTHLGNAWRHGDVVALPVLDTNTTSKYSLELLKKRDLTMLEADSIVNEIKRKDYKVHKTGALNRFNCPDDLVIPFATAILICSLFSIKRKGVLIDSNGNRMNNFAIDFGTKKNTFTQKPHNAFFNGFNEGEFEFQSLKMNRTVLTLMYMVLVKKGNSSAALQLSQRLRAHENFENTNIYLVIPDEELDALCESLFNRKQFGYIPDLLATILIGENTDRDKRTEDIQTICSTFGNIHHIEATTGFINKTIAERELVAEKIFNSDIDTVQDLLFDLKTNVLPSNEKNFQCIVSPKCQKPELDSCKDCPYAIPNFYAISSLVESVKLTILEFLNEFDVDSFEGEKTRLMNRLYIDMDNLERAMQKFGQTEIFNFFENGVDEYNELLDLLDELQSKTGEEFEKYLTYKPVYIT